MSSPRRIESSRNNGAQSQGPTTPEGKSRSAQNAFTHGLTGGLTAKTIILTNEAAPLFEAMLSNYVNHFEPANPVQADLVEELAVAKWRQRRLWLIESAALDFEMDRQDGEVAKTYQKVDEPTRLALAFKALGDSSNVLSNLSRYESRHRRAYENALKRLEGSPNELGKTNPVPFPDTQDLHVQHCQELVVQTSATHDEPIGLTGKSSN